MLLAKSAAEQEGNGTQRDGGKLRGASCQSLRGGVVPVHLALGPLRVKLF